MRRSVTSRPNRSVHMRGVPPHRPIYVWMRPGARGNCGRRRNRSRIAPGTMKGRANHDNPPRVAPTMTTVGDLDRIVKAYRLLTHPFYRAWSDGTLPRSTLREYATQYYHFEVNFPR
ncbi:MAG: thiaminase II/PqqC family protein, partial [Thermoplasmata archaeon]